MKRWLILIGFLALAALDWAALHDILKGEQDVWLEWSFVLVSFVLVAVVVGKRLVLKIKR